MTCKCGSSLIINFQAKCGDLSRTCYKSYNTDGYVPRGLSIGGGDYIDFDFCAACGLIQHFAAIEETELELILS
jgi:hypothetical protein